MSPRFRNELLALARSLLYAEQSRAAHKAVLAVAMAPGPSQAVLERLAGRTLAWTVTRPQPRAKVVARLLGEDRLLRALLGRYRFEPLRVGAEPCMRRWPDTEALPAIVTLGELAAWLRVDTGYLKWFADAADRNGRSVEPRLEHYNRRVLPKRDGRLRLVEAPKQHLKHLQRQIQREIVSQVPLGEAVHGFRRGRSVRTFAEPHAGSTVVLRMDLEDFFPRISGPRVQALFRTLGYPEGVADALGALCTVTTPRRFWRGFGDESSWEARSDVRTMYARVHLPQGAPTSPTLANLCARRLDQRLMRLAESVGGRYTRYADDLAFSGEAAFGRALPRLQAQVGAIALEEGFAVQYRKTRVMRAGVRQTLAGVVVNERPNLPRADVDRLKATLVNCVREGPLTQNRERRPDFRAYLEGKVAYLAMVNARKGARLRALLGQIDWQTASGGVPDIS